MTVEAHHQASLIETARLELERAHRAALALDAGEMRRGVQLALDALHQAAVPVEAAAEAPVPPATVRRLAGMLDRVLADLGNGRLAELGALLEAARKELAGGDG